MTAPPRSDPSPAPPILREADYQRLMPLVQWCSEEASQSNSLAEVVTALSERMRTAGLPVDRCNLTLPTLHPQVAARSAVWRPELGAQVVSRRWEDKLTPDFTGSPVRVLHEGTATEVAALDLSAPPQEFAEYDAFRAQGMTGYIALAIQGESSVSNMLSVATKQAGGFTETHLLALRVIASAITPLLAIMVLRSIAQNVCATYIGPVTGPRVLAGSIQRGSVETLKAVVWFCDLRGFTALSEELGAEGMVELLNEFFGSIGEAIERHDGEILKFIGDAALAIFPLREGDDEAAVCAIALQAAQEAMAAIAQLNAERALASRPEIRFGIGLHVGDVSYGNIGARNRLDFTVIGPAVNLASRLEGLCGRLGEPLLASARFAEALGGGLREVGEYELKGLRARQRIYAIG